jgi:predicted amidohydrolase YtcJ
MIQIRKITAVSCLVLAMASCSSHPRTAAKGGDAMRSTGGETLILGGTALVGAAERPESNVGILVRDGLIAQVGPMASMRASYPSARVVDASRYTILPGLTDAHGHLYGLGVALDTVDLGGAASYDEVIARVRRRAASASAGEWIEGRGWDQNLWPGKQFPTAGPMDAAVPDVPVWIRRVDGHAGLANSAAMRAAGVTASTPDPEGGRIIRDAGGQPTGVFVDAATSIVDRAVPPPSPALVKARVLEAAQAIAAQGLTEMHDAGEGDEVIHAVQELIDEHRFPIRVYMMLSDDDEHSVSPRLRRWFARGPLMAYGGRLTIRSVKLYADGALGSRGAALLDPYDDDPANRGLTIASPEHIQAVASAARAAGFQVNTHAIGDRGVRNVIDAYEAAGASSSDRFRIEHLQIIAPADLPRLRQHGIIASMQPTHATSDMYWAESRIGPTRIQGAYAWRKVLDSGARLALGSDFPVEHVNPFFGIYAAVTRQDQKGYPEGGWYPSQRLTLAEAIRGFTSDAAFAAFEESSRGTIEPGKVADFTIVDRNPYDIPAAELYRLQPMFTIVAGEVVYSK